MIARPQTHTLLRFQMNAPTHMHPWADEILQALAAHPEAGEIVLGGYFALQHFLDYRETNDIDAWWRSRAEGRTIVAIREVLREFAQRRACELRERQFGETWSFELIQQGKKRFSFQIAVRSRELQPPVLSRWPPILIETLDDNIGSKMNALVDRGAPRDFVDIRKIVEGGLAAAAHCWEVWSHKNEEASVSSAQQKVLGHLSALELRRPLASIADSEEREQSRQTREWFRTVFVRS